MNNYIAIKINSILHFIFLIKENFLVMINDIINIAVEAGEVIKDGFGKNIQVDFKSNESNLVTEIDKKSENHIIDFIKKKFPSHGILTEESGEVKSSSDFLWVIDPLDGTTNFAHGLPIFSVSIGVQKNNKTIAGVVFDVMQNFIYAAEIGAGSFCNSEKLFVSKNESLRRSLLVTGFPYDVADNPHKALDIFSLMIKSSRGIRRLGSAAIDFCYVAKGAFDGFWEVHLNPWDICAGKLIVEEAGGTVTDFNSSDINIFNNKILCSNKLIHQQMISIINSV